MNAKIALLTALMTFAPAALVGCSGADSRAEEDPTTEGDSTQDALAVGIQTVNLYASSLGLGAAQGSDNASPVKTFKFANGQIKYNAFTGTIFEATAKGVKFSKEILDLAVLLKLGAYASSEGAAGSSYHNFAKGYVRVTNETGVVSEVGFGTGNYTSVSAQAGLAAAYSRVGTFVSWSQAGNVATAKFSAGAVKYSLQTGAVDDVTLTGVAGATKNAATKLGLGAYVRGTHERGVDHDTYAKGTVHFNTLTGKVISVDLNEGNGLPAFVVDNAVGLNLGAHTGSDGAAGTQYETFQKGTISWNNHDVLLKTVQVITSGGQSVDLPLPVAAAAAANAFGTLSSVEGAAGSAYYSFPDGVVRWSNVTQSLAEVTLK